MDDNDLTCWPNLTRRCMGQADVMPILLLTDANATACGTDGKCVGNLVQDKPQASSAMFLQHLQDCDLWLPATFDGLPLNLKEVSFVRWTARNGLTTLRLISVSTRCNIRQPRLKTLYSHTRSLTISRLWCGYASFFAVQQKNLRRIAGYDRASTSDLEKQNTLQILFGMPHHSIQY